jgi:hypothetical protein
MRESKMTTTIDDYALRSKRAAQSDGLNDVLGGITFLAITFMQYAGMQARATIHGHNFEETHAYQESHIYFALAICAQFALIFLSRRGVEHLRQRFVYPRMGYVSPRTAPKYRMLIFAVVGVSAVFLIGVVGKFVAQSGGRLTLWPPEMTVVLFGVIWGVAYGVFFAQLGFLRHLVLAGIGIVASLLLASTPLQWEYRCGWFVILLGISSIVAGMVSFLRLIRTPALTEADAQ